MLDTLEQGTTHNKEFAIIYEQLFVILKKKGLERIEAKEGSQFNHETMDCLMQEENEKFGEDKVCKILLLGYKLNGKVLRHAKVSVNKMKKNKGEIRENEDDEEKNNKNSGIAKQKNNEKETPEGFDEETEERINEVEG